MNLSLRHILLFIGLSSAAIVGSALISQYGFGLHPCHLCMLQRYPYYTIIGLSLIGLWFSCAARYNSRILKSIITINLLLLLTDAGIAIYHTGVELGWFPGPESCSSSGSAGKSLEEIRAEIFAAPLVSCNQAMAHFMGLSMAGWNAVAAIFLIIVTLLLLKNRVKESKI